MSKIAKQPDCERQIENNGNIRLIKSGSKVKKKTPPSTDIQSVQFDLFKQFVTNDQSEVSNTIELWESIPKYFFTPHKVKQLRTEKGHADPYKWRFTQNGQECLVVIQPALIEQDDGSYQASFPGVTEELIEEVLKKILTEQQHGIHDPEKAETWVRFTLRSIHKELKERGRTRSIDEIKQSVQIMNKCILTYSIEGTEQWSGAILQDLVTVGRKEYEEDNNAHHIARLPLFISIGINKLATRQFNYKRFMRCDEQLAKWVYKRLINRYKQASMLNTYHCLYSDLKKTGLLDQKQEKDNRRKAASALDELVNRDVLKDYSSEVRKEGRKIVDVKYTLLPSSAFISEQKAANKRSTNQLKKAPILPVDN